MIVAISAFVIVAGAVGWMAFSFKHSPAKTPTPNATPLALATPLAIGTPLAGSASTPASVSESATASPVQSAGAATGTGTATATATANATKTATTTTTPAATGTAVAKATKTATSTSSSGSNPAVGDFGELPSADVPTGNSAGRAMSLDYRLNMSLQNVPQTATVYQLQPKKWTKDDVATLAKSLGITGAVSDQGGGSFHATGGGDLYVAGNLVQYVAGQSNATPGGGALPSDGAAVQAARSWLLQHNIVGANIGNGTVVSRDESANQIQVRVMPADPDNILSATPSATVTVGPGGSILEVSSRWPGSTQRSSYGLRSADDLWSDARNGQGYIEVNPSDLPSGSLSGTATVTGSSIAYTVAGSPDGTQYLVPLVVFTGQATFNGSGAIPIKIYVPAAGAQAAPRG